MNIKRIHRRFYKILKNTLLKISKRRRFIISSSILTIILILTQLFPADKIFLAVFFQVVLSLLLSLWCLWEDLKGVEFLLLLLPPFLYTLGLGLFYYLLPLRWVTRLPVGALYAIGMYALYLTQNIFNVAVIRTIGLLRAARTVSLLFSLITAFFLLNTLFSFHLIFYWNFIFVFIISFLIILPLFWQEKLTPNLEKNILIVTLVSALIMAEVSLVLSFWPLKVTFISLYLISFYYSLIGVNQIKLKDLPLKNSIWEYLILSLLAFFMLVKTAAWQI